MSGRGNSIGTLEPALQNWGLNFPFDEIWPAFQMFDLTQYRVLPGAGGYLDQDPLLMEDFKTLMLLKEWHSIPDTPTPKLGNDW